MSTISVSTSSPTIKAFWTKTARGKLQKGELFFGADRVDADPGARQFNGSTT